MGGMGPGGRPGQYGVPGQFGAPGQYGMGVSGTGQFVGGGAAGGGIGQGMFQGVQGTVFNAVSACKSATGISTEALISQLSHVDPAQIR
jgi:hypothetical protein